MAQTPVTVLIVYQAQPGKEDAGLDALASLVATVVAEEPACLGITIHQDASDPARILLLEEWVDKASYVGPHMQTPAPPGLHREGAGALRGAARHLLLGAPRRKARRLTEPGRSRGAAARAESGHERSRRRAVGFPLRGRRERARGRGAAPRRAVPAARERVDRALLLRRARRARVRPDPPSEPRRGLRRGRRRPRRRLRRARLSRTSACSSTSSGRTEGKPGGGRLAALGGSAQLLLVE